MSINVGTAIAYLDLDNSNFKTGIRTSLSELNKFSDSSLTSTKKLESLGNSMTSMGKTLTLGFTVPLAGIGGIALNSAIKFESAFAGVRKTVDATADEYDMLSSNIKKMATETASSSVEIAGVMEIAGQLGVQIGKNGETITRFTRTMVQLGDATNLTAEESATSLAQFMNIMGTATDKVQNLGSAVVALGNNFATDERSIVQMSTRLASAGKIAGLTEQNILALSTSMASVGIQAEAGGTAMSQTLAAIETAVAEGGDSLLQFAKIAGLTSSEFASKWKSAPMEAIQLFIRGIGELDKQGQSATLILDDMGLSGIRQSNMLKALALSSENMTEAVQLSNQAWEENTALAKEAEERYGTTESQLHQLKESFNNVAIEIGEILIPYLQKLVDWLSKVVDWWNQLSETQKDIIVKIGLVVAAIGPLLIAGGNILKFVVEMKALGGLASIFGTAGGAGALAAGATKTAGAIGGVGKALGGLGASQTVASGALATAGTALGKVGGVAVTTAGALMTFDVIKNPVIKAIGAITGDIETQEKMLKRYGYQGDSVRIVADSWDLLKKKVEGMPAALNGASESSKALGLAIEKINKGMIYTDEQLVRMQDNWKFTSDDIETLRQEMLMTNDGFTKITDNFSQLNEASAQTIQQVATGLESMANSGKTVDDVLNGNVKNIGDLTHQASSFFHQLKDGTVSVVTSVGEIEQKLTDQKGILTVAGKDIVRGLNTGIKEETKATKETVDKLLNEIKTPLNESPKEAKKSAQTIVKEFNKGIEQNKKSTNETANKWTTEIENPLKEFQKKAGVSGQNTVKGFNTGISSESKTTDAIITAWTDRTLNTVHVNLEERSPSLATERSGKNFVKGLNNGIEKNSSSSSVSVGGWLSAILDIVNNASNVSSAKKAGSNIINDMLSGMKDAWKSVTSWLSSEISSLNKTTNKYTSSLKISGSHEDGLSYVPYNGYIAKLHEGERVLTKEENKSYGTSSNEINVNIYSPKQMDEYEAARQFKKVALELDL